MGRVSFFGGETAEAEVAIDSNCRRLCSAKREEGGEHKGKQFSSPSPQKMGGKKKMGGGEAESSAESSSSFITSVEGWGRTIGITPPSPLNVLTITGTMAATGHKGGEREREREAQQPNGRQGRDCLSPEGWMDGCFGREEEFFTPGEMIQCRIGVSGVATEKGRGECIREGSDGGNAVATDRERRFHHLPKAAFNL